MKKKASIVILIIFLLSIFCSLPAIAQVTAIKAGKLIDLENGKVSNNAVIIIENKIIKSLGLNVPIPAGAEIIDLSDMTVLPGLFDCHTHVCENIRANGINSLSFESSNVFDTTLDRALVGVMNAKSFLETGFTTIRDVGNAGEFADIALKKAINNGIIPGPTMLVTGKIISPTGGQYHVNYDYFDYPKRDYIYADTHDEMVRAIRKNIYFGADWIKIIIDDQRYVYTAEDIGFIVKEAGNAGVKVAAHAVTERGAMNSIEGGLESIEHGFIMSDKALRLAKEKGVWLCGTDFSKEVWEVYRAPQMYSVIVDRLKRAYKIGVKMAFGSDLVFKIPGYDRGQAALTLLTTWVDAGIPPLDILRAMTTDAAEMLDLKNSRGIIKPGAFADIIAAPDNPLEDIFSLRNVKFVMKNGKVYKNVK
jgi:imidazolonepropionase-like amidohydrolase